MCKIAFIPKNSKDIETIRQQLFIKRISNIDVLLDTDDLSKYEIIKYNIEPSKQFAEYLDLGQTTSLHGFHTDPFTPVIKDLNNPEMSKKALEVAKSKLSLEDLKVILDSSEPELVTRESFNVKMQELKARLHKAEQEEKENLSIQDLMKLFHLSKEPISVITIGAQIMTKCYGRPVSNKGFEYSYDPFWISQPWEEAFTKYPDKKSQWFKALKTRIGNVIKEEKKYASIRFFIDFLVKNYLEESVSMLDEYRKPASNNFHIPNIEINEEDIPF